MGSLVPITHLLEIEIIASVLIDLLNIIMKTINIMIINKITDQNRTRDPKKKKTHEIEKNCSRKNHMFPITISIGT